MQNEPSLNQFLGATRSHAVCEAAIGLQLDPLKRYRVPVAEVGSTVALLLAGQSPGRGLLISQGAGLALSISGQGGLNIGERHAVFLLVRGGELQLCCFDSGGHLTERFWFNVQGLAHLFSKTTTTGCAFSMLETGPNCFELNIHRGQACSHPVLLAPVHHLLRTPAATSADGYFSSIRYSPG